MRQVRQAPQARRVLKAHRATPAHAATRAPLVSLARPAPSLNASITIDTLVTGPDGALEVAVLGAGWSALEGIALTVIHPDGSEAAAGPARATNSGIFLYNLTIDASRYGVYGIVAQGDAGGSASGVVWVADK